MQKIRSIIQNSLYFLSSNAVNMTLGMIASIVLARTLQPTKLGIYHQVLWFSGIISSLISLGYITSIIRFSASYKAKNNPDGLKSMLKHIIIIELIITVISSIGLIVIAPLIADHYFSPNEARFFIIAFVAITPGMQTAIFSALLEGVQNFKYQGLQSVTITPLSLISKIVLLLMGYGIESMLWANLAFSLINLSFYIWAGKREGLIDGLFKASTMDSEEKQKLGAYNKSVFSISLVDQIVWNRSENYFLGRYCQASQLAFYNLAQNLVLKITGVIPSLMWKVLLPLASEQEENKDPKYRNKTYYFALRYSAFLIFPICTVCIVCAYEIIVLLYGQAYSQAEGCFQLLCIGTIFTCLSQPGSAVIYAANKQRYIFWYGGILAILNLLLNYLLIPRFGALGAGFCFSVVTILGSIGGFVYLIGFMKLKVPWFSLFKISFSCVFLGIILFLLIRQDIETFNVFKTLRGWLNENLHSKIAYLFHPRFLRLTFAVFTGFSIYILLSLVLFKPDKDDIRILTAMDKYLPKLFIKGIFKIKNL